MKPTRIGICGLGVVGSGVVHLLRSNAEVIARRLGTAIDIVLIGARHDNPDCDTSDLALTRDIFDVVNSPDVDIIVELIGGTDTAKDVILQAIRSGKHVVTANKALIAEHGSLLVSEAEKHGVMLNFEAAVAAGIPVLQCLKDSLIANDIQEVVGIINGTSNYILSAMTFDGISFTKALANAQAMGYAESDPTFDIEGFDAAHKITILAAMAFGIPVDFDKVHFEGITRIEQEDIIYAKELGYIIKHVGIACKSRHEGEIAYEIRVHPALLTESNLLAQVHGVTNAVAFQAHPAGEILLTGPGAGAGSTASAVVADIMNIIRYSVLEQSLRPPILGFQQHMIESRNILPIEDIESAWYLRLKVQDKFGVMADIATIFAGEGISLEAIIQKEPHANDSDYVSIVLLTRIVTEHKIARAQTHLENLDSIKDRIQKIRLLPSE